MGNNYGTSVSASLKAVAKLLEMSATAGADVLKSLSGTAPGAITGLVDWASSEMNSGSCCSCDIPPPCWMPRQLCEVVSYGKAGNTASVTFVITNESMATRTISVVTTTPLPGLTISATTLTLTAMERGTIEVSYVIPGTLTAGPGTEILLWVRGCKLHFLRWTVKLGLVSADTDYEVCVKDGPENLHHWYDHFYCPHPCLPELRDRG
jgi:hypothetical protein